MLTNIIPGLDQGLRPNRFILIRKFLNRRSEMTARVWWVTLKFRTKILPKTLFNARKNVDETMRKILKWFNLISILIHYDLLFIWIFIHFDLRFNLILLILIRFDFDSSRITIHPRIKSRIKSWWIVIQSFTNHWLTQFRIKSESKWIANKAGPRPASIQQWVEDLRSYTWHF